jgi:hypothetical protein
MTQDSTLLRGPASADIRRKLPLALLLLVVTGAACSDDDEPCDEAGGMCAMFTFVVACRDRCEADDDVVLCKHSRDCLDDDDCNFNPLGPPFLPRCEAP